MKTKPIFVCYVNTPEYIKDIRDKLYRELGGDYYVLVVCNDTDNIKFELFNSELEEKDFKDLKVKLNINEN